MISKEEYYENVLEYREIANDKKNLRCSCENLTCEWHGKCKECVALHRYYKDHIPNCLQPILNDKLKDLVSVCEMVAAKKEDNIPMEYKLYVKEKDKENI